MASLAPYPYWQFLDDDGNLLSGGKVYTYENNTTTNKTAYTNAAETASATNPIILDAYGRAVIYLSGTYTLKITDASNNLIRTVNDVAGTGTSASQIAYSEDTGVADAYVLTPNPPITAYAAGQTVDFIPDNSNTGASTVQISGLSAKSIKMPDGAATPRGALLSTGSYTLFYNGTDFVVQNPSGGKHSIWVPAVAMIPRTTNGAASGTAESSSNKVMIKTLDFDQSTDEFAQFTINMPKSWNEGTVTARFIWSAAGGDGDVIWGVQGLALGDADTIDTAFGTAVTVTDNDGTTGTLRITAETSAMTIGNTPAEGDAVVFQVYRDADNGSDTFNADARLHGVMLFYTTSAVTDA
jgi:hypothetical protein